MTAPLRFAFGVHLHQPVGNFDHVFEEHVRDVYEPFLQRIADRELFPIIYHVSGPLLLWLETRAPSSYLDLVQRLAEDGKIELLLSGLYEPILASLPRRDRVEQVEWMRDAVMRRFGIRATGLWLTERVWEPELAADLADAGVEFALVDDWHFLTAGFDREQLYAPLWTESDGKRLALFPIDEELRYLVPFADPAVVHDYLWALHAAGRQLAVLVDDGEKFGGWPGTHAWVYEKNWLGRFLDAMTRLIERDAIVMTSLTSALTAVPSGGLAYLPTASYREMEEWALPPAPAMRLARLKHDLGEERLKGPDGTLVRGSHWKHFLVKYPEANWMHKKMVTLSALCRERGDPPAVRHAVGKAQCNDAYWHGVFGGLYLPHLRHAVWHHLAVAERDLRHGEPLTAEIRDLDADGHDEVWVHSAAFSAIVSPRRGGTIVEYTNFASCINYADVLTRRVEAYHGQDADEVPPTAVADDEIPSIHALEEGSRTAELPPLDAYQRGIFIERVLPKAITLQEYAGGAYRSAAGPANRPMSVRIETSPGVVELTLAPEDPVAGDGWLRDKRLRFEADGTVEATFRWVPDALPANAWFATEVSHREGLEIHPTPQGKSWTHPITTTAKSERGLEETHQGTSTTIRWPVALGTASIRLAPA